MFDVTPDGDNRLILDIAGTIDRETMARGLDALLAASDGFSGGLMLYRIRDFHWPALDALAIEVRRLPALFGLLRRFDRVAVVADPAWIRRVSEWEGALMPGIAIKGFAEDEEDAAIRWLDGSAAL